MTRYDRTNAGDTRRQIDRIAETLQQLGVRLSIERQRLQELQDDLTVATRISIDLAAELERLSAPRFEGDR